MSEELIPGLGLPDLPSQPQPEPLQGFSSASQMWAAQESAAKSRPGLWDSLAIQSLTGDIASAIVYRLNTPDADPNWAFKDQRETGKLFLDIPPEYHDDIMASGSMFEAQLTRQQILTKLEAADRVSREGAVGLALSLGVGVGETLPVAMLTGGTGIPAVLSGGGRAASVYNYARVFNASRRTLKAAELARGFSTARLLALGGLHGAASGVAYTALDSLVDPTVEGHDFMVAGLLGGGLGSISNGLFGRSMIKSNLMRGAMKYEQRMFNAGKEGVVRFGADDIVQQIGRRFGVSEDEARAIVMVTRAFDNAADVDWGDIAVAGPRARVTGDRRLVQRITGQIDDAKYAVESYHDGKIIIRALNESQNPKAFVKSVAEVVRRRLYNEDNGLLTNEQVMLLDDMVGARVSRVIGVTESVEAGVPPVGIPAWEVRTGSNLRTIYGVQASPWSPEVSSARSNLSKLRTQLRTVTNSLKAAYDEAVEAGTEADNFYNFVRLDRPKASQAIKELRKQARVLSKQIEKSEKALKDLSGKELRRMVLDSVSENKRMLAEASKRTKAFKNARRNELAGAKRAVGETATKYEAELQRLADEERRLASELKKSEDALGNLDREYMIRRRQEAWSDQEADRFSDMFLRWLKNSDTSDLPPEMAEVFKRVRDSLGRMYSTGLDSLIMSAKVSDEVDVFFRDIFDRNLQQRLSQEAATFQSNTFNRLSAIASGASVGPKPVKAAVEPNSLPTDFNDAPYVNTRILGFNLAKLPWLNRSVAAMNNGIGAVRWLGNRMMWARVHPEDALGRPVVQRATVWEGFNRLRRIMESDLIREHQAAFNLYMTGADDAAKVSPLVRAANGWQHQSKERFAREVYEEIVSPGSSTNKAVKRAAEAYRSHFKKMAAMAEEVELPGFVGLAPDGTYFPRLWKWELVDEFTSGPEGTKPLAKLIRESLQIPVVESVDDPEFIAGRAITADGRDALALYMAERLRQLARGENKNAYLDMDEVMLEVLRDEGLNTKFRNLKNGPHLTPRGRQRLPMDVSIKVDLGNGRKASLIDYLSIDVVQATESYNRSVFGAMAEKTLVDEFRDQLVARGVFTAEEAANEIQNWAGIRSYLKSNAGRNVRTEDIDAQIGHLDEIMAGIRSEPTPNTWGTLASQYIGRVLKLGYLRNGQAFGLSSLTEFSRVVGRSSFSSMMKQMPIIKELAAAARKGQISKEDSPLLWWIDHALGTGTDRLRRTELGIIDSRIERLSPETRRNMFAGFNRWVKTKADPNLNQAVIFFSDATGLAPITSATQHMMTASIIQEMFDNALANKAIYSDALLNQWGITRAEFDSMLKQLRKHGKVDSRGRVIDVGSENWNQNTYGRFLDFLERGTVSSIQDPPTRGDFHKALWSPLGRLLTQFRTFNVKGISNFLMTTNQRRDHRVFAEYMAAMMFGTLIQMSRKAIFAPRFAGDKEQKDYWDKSFSNQALLGYAVTGPTENYLLTTVTDSITNFMYGEGVFQQSRYSNLSGGFLSISSTPAGKFAEDVYRAFGGLSQAVLREDKEITRKTLNNFRVLIPANKMVIISDILSGIEAGASDAFDLKEK